MDDQQFEQQLRDISLRIAALHEGCASRSSHPESKPGADNELPTKFVLAGHFGSLTVCINDLLKYELFTKSTIRCVYYLHYSDDYDYNYTCNKGIKITAASERLCPPAGLDRQLAALTGEQEAITSAIAGHDAALALLDRELVELQDELRQWSAELGALDARLQQLAHGLAQTDAALVERQALARQQLRIVNPEVPTAMLQQYIALRRDLPSAHALLWASLDRSSWSGKLKYVLFCLLYPFLCLLLLYRIPRIQQNAESHANLLLLQSEHYVLLEKVRGERSKCSIRLSQARSDFDTKTDKKRRRSEALQQLSERLSAISGERALLELQRKKLFNRLIELLSCEDPAKKPRELHAYLPWRLAGQPTPTAADVERLTLVVPPAMEGLQPELRDGYRELVAKSDAVLFFTDEQAPMSGAARVLAKYLGEHARLALLLVKMAQVRRSSIDRAGPVDGQFNRAREAFADCLGVPLEQVVALKVAPGADPHHSTGRQIGRLLSFAHAARRCFAHGHEVRAVTSLIEQRQRHLQERQAALHAEFAGFQRERPPDLLAVCRSHLDTFRNALSDGRKNIAGRQGHQFAAYVNLFSQQQDHQSKESADVKELTVRLGVIQENPLLAVLDECMQNANAEMATTVDALLVRGLGELLSAYGDLTFPEPPDPTFYNDNRDLHRQSCILPRMRTVASGAIGKVNGIREKHNLSQAGITVGRGLVNYGAGLGAGMLFAILVPPAAGLAPAVATFAKVVVAKATRLVHTVLNSHMARSLCDDVKAITEEYCAEFKQSYDAALTETSLATQQRAEAYAETFLSQQVQRMKPAVYSALKRWQAEFNARQMRLQELMDALACAEDLAKQARKLDQHQRELLLVLAQSQLTG